MPTAVMGGSTVLMDPGSAFTLLLSCPAGVPRSRVSVDFGILHDRIAHPDVNLEESINEIWTRRMEKNQSLYNGKKFRYGGHILQSANNANKKSKSSVCLQLGLTDYRTFIGTNLSPLWENFLVPFEGESIHCQHLASPLGNGAIVETADKRVLILKRSHNVGEFPGYFVFPGGHSEPEEVGVSSHQINEGSIQYEVLKEKIAQEMFDGIIREVVEEIGVPAESLVDPILIGITRRNLNLRPTAFFFVRCSLESHEIQELYLKALDGYESTQLYAASNEDLLKISERMPGCHRGGCALYEKMLKGDNAGL